MDEREVVLRARRSAFHNIYGKEAVEAFCGDGAEVIESGESVAALCGEEKLVRIYWSIRDEKAIPSLLEQVRQRAGTQPLVSEIIYRENCRPTAIKSLLQAGMRQYSRLVYMTRIPVPPPPGGYPRCADNLHCKRAAIKDIDTIYQLLWETFDPLISHLPNHEQVKEHIQKGNAFVMRKHDKIISAALFQETGSQAKYLYQLVTVQEERGKGLAEALLNHELQRDGDQCVFSLWVEESNNSAINLYTKYGFVHSGRELSVLTDGCMR